MSCLNPFLGPHALVRLVLSLVLVFLLLPLQLHDKAGDPVDLRVSLRNELLDGSFVEE